MAVGRAGLEEVVDTEAECCAEASEENVGVGGSKGHAEVANKVDGREWPIFRTYG